MAAAAAAAAADLQGILAGLPGRHIVYCFAYGSGVFRQAGGTTGTGSAAAGPMVDLMLVVDDSVGFHRDNLAANPGHYSSLRHLGAAAVAAVQTSAFGARVYFNTHVPAPDGRTLYKYGVTDVRDFRRDLLSWRSLYVAGRLHKPVLTLVDGAGELSGLVARNLESAVHAALLQLPGSFAERDLYTTVAGLSYTGDFRMVVGEDRHKVANIVRPQLHRFRSLYGPAVDSMAGALTVDHGRQSAVQDKTVDGTVCHLRRLPAHLKRAILNGPDEDGRLRELAERGADDVGRIVRAGVSRIVFRSSVTQTLKGIPTAGLVKSVVYSYGKLNKMVRSMMMSQ